MPPPLHIAIALATYNGARFLAAQLESLQSQTFADWRLLVRDDGSQDDTCAIVRSFAARDARIELLEDSRGRQGPTGNFGALLAETAGRDADYLLFADQDDVWREEKIARQLACMSQLETGSPPGTPLLVHSDLTVVDAELQVLHPSFMAYQGIHHEERAPLRTLLLQNFVTGCTCLLNRPLMELALPIPGELPVHDWWVAVCAAAAGRIGFVPEPTVLYRQHGGNTVGAKGHWASLNLFRYAWRRLRRNGAVPRQCPFEASIGQAELLGRRLSQRRLCTGSPESQLIAEYCRWYRTPPGIRLRALRFRSLGIRRQSLIKHLALYAWLWRHSATENAS